MRFACWQGFNFDVSLHEPATDETIQDAHSFSSSDSSSREPSEHETNQFCHPESQSLLDGSNISFSDLQIERPVVIEIFCGSARVTARLREVGLSDAFGVDHDISKATASAKQLDFTKQSDQRIFLQWLRSPLVVGIFRHRHVERAQWPEISLGILVEKSYRAPSRYIQLSFLRD